MTQLLTLPSSNLKQVKSVHMGILFVVFAQWREVVARALKRTLIEACRARKRIKCRWCLKPIYKGMLYTHSTLIGFWGSYHNACFDQLSVNFKTEDMGNPVPNQSEVALSLQTGAVLKDLIQQNTGGEEMTKKVTQPACKDCQHYENGWCDPYKYACESRRFFNCEHYLAKATGAKAPGGTK